MSEEFSPQNLRALAVIYPQVENALKQAAEDRELLQKQAIDLPTGSVETHRITVLSYLDTDGVNKYAVDAKGNAPMTSYLGLLVVAQRDVLGWGSDVEYY